MNEELRAHGTTVEVNRGMKGEYSIRIVSRSDDREQARQAALQMLRNTERDLGITSAWHAGWDEDF